MIHDRAHSSDPGIVERWLPLAVIGVAVFAGMATAVVAGRAGFKAVYYAFVFGLLGAGTLVAITRDEPMRLVYFVLLLSFPLANALVPPGRIGLKVFDVVMIFTAAVLIVKYVLRTGGVRQPLFPGRSMAIAWSLSVPCIAFSVFPGLSAQIMVVTAGVYAFFLMSLRELQRDGGFERLTACLAVVMLTVAGGIFIDHVFHVNLGMRGTNFNQFSYAGGVPIRRASGFFQDPQIAGAFLACTITFMILLLVRGRFSGSRLRFLVSAAVLAGFAALFLTISRGAIISCVGVSLLSIFVFNRWGGALKLLSVAVFVGVAVSLAMVPFDTLLKLAPPAFAQRFQDIGESLDDRLMIWFDTWEMFADHPMTGIGPGAFRPYLLETRPGIFNFYGIGQRTGEVYVPDQPESGYLKILYEGGLAGAVAATLVALDAVRRAFMVIRANTPLSHARTEAVAALGALVTFAVTFITLFTWTDARIAGFVSLLLGVIWCRSLELCRHGNGKP